MQKELIPLPPVGCTPLVLLVGSPLVNWRREQHRPTSSSAMYRNRSSSNSRPFARQPGQSTKALDIPQDVPVGAVIGKGGSTCRSLQDKFSVRCSVDADKRTIKISGARSAVVDAETELERLFGEFALQSKRVYEVVALDGPRSLWQFQERSSATRDANVSSHRYLLKRVGPCDVAPASRPRSWIQPYNRANLDDLMAYLIEDERHAESPPHVEVAFGHLCFALKHVDADAVLIWDELQQLKVQEDFSSRWSNICDVVSIPEVKKLVDKLVQVAEETGAVWHDELGLHVDDRSLQRHWQVKYRHVDGLWKLHLMRLAKRTLGSFDVLMDGKPSMRARAQVRPKAAELTADGLQRFLSVRKSPSGDFWDTKVVLGANAPSELSVNELHVVQSTRVEWNGLRFKIGFCNAERSQVRLKCTMSAMTKATLGAEENENQVLLEKALDLVE